MCGKSDMARMEWFLLPWGQTANALLGILVMELGRSSFFRLVQFSKELVEITETEEGISTDLRFEQSKNAAPPIVVTLSGISMEPRLVHLLKVY